MLGRGWGNQFLVYFPLKPPRSPRGLDLSVEYAQRHSCSELTSGPGDMTEDRDRERHRETDRQTEGQRDRGGGENESPVL